MCLGGQRFRQGSFYNALYAYSALQHVIQKIYYVINDDDPAARQQR